MKNFFIWEIDENGATIEKIFMLDEIVTTSIGQCNECYSVLCDFLLDDRIDNPSGDVDSGLLISDNHVEAGEELWQLLNWLQ